MKTKIYVDFLIEPPQRKERHECWSLTTDRFSNKKCGGVEVILESLDDITLEQVVQINFDTSNNQAEYEALIT